MCSASRAGSELNAFILRYPPSARLKVIISAYLLWSLPAGSK